LSTKPACVNIPLVVKNLSFLLIILLFSGCSSSKKTIIADSLDATPVITGSVIDAAAFQKGGTLVLGAFKPGPGAAADDETDRLSLAIVKGIKETLPDDAAHFTLVPDDQKDSDCFLDGYIEDYGRKGHMVHLSVDGEIWLQSSGEKIFSFQTAIMIDLKTQNPKTIAYQIGIAIAHFIGSHMQEG